MKQLCLLIVLIVAWGSCFARETKMKECKIFDVPRIGTPKPVSKLGTSPEFPQLRHLKSNYEVYTRIRNMDKTKGQGQNMNALFIEMGYSGIDDPEFKEDDIQKSYLPFGAIGMLGDGSHNYVYSILVVPGKQKLDCWKINAKDADHNDLYFMSDCGNAFYNTNPGAEPAAMATAPAAAPEKKPADMEIKVYARYKPEPCNCCASYGDDMGNEWNYDKEEKTLLSKQKVEPMQVSENNVIVVQEVYIDVDKATYKKLKKHDTVVKYESRTEMDTSKMYSKK